MAKSTEPRIAAHLGRPETAEEEAARKAENSRNYRQSQNVRNLLVALGVTLAIVAVIYFGVPRGDVTQTADIDVAGIAETASEQYARDVVVPEMPSSWGVNAAAIDPGNPIAWGITYNSIPDAPRSFARFAQGFDTTDTWAAQVLGGASPDETIEISGVEWSAYEISDPSSNGNISYALGTQAGDDFLLVYGSISADDARQLAEAATQQISQLEQESTE
ncbi:DUF4245 family protein [Microbacterium indicum]|uniref:DUF4245 family protein n=1 Tax=Microbacterium indicum TaxID=358100 RepID=UPI00048C01AD|nr:DUF4245 family protein [Microbacterium indicum]